MIRPVEPMDELIRCFDEQGREIEPHTRAEIHQRPFRYWHAVAVVFLVDRQGRLVCSRRSEHLSQKPGCWQAAFGGHIRAGQGYEQGVLRELGEEAGLTIQESDLHFLGDSLTPEHKHRSKIYCTLFTGELGDLSFTDGEITEVKWLGLNEPWEEKQRQPERWATVCKPETQEKIKQWLNTLPEKK